MRRRESVVAVDIGGTNIRAALVSPSGEIQHKVTVRNTFHDGVENIITRLISVIDQAMDAAEMSGVTIAGLGVASAGQINDFGKIIGSCILDSDLIGIDLGQILRDRYASPVVVDNDGNAGVLGEYLHGAGRGYRSVIGLVIGTGVGGGVIIDGKLHRGATGAAFEVGHISVDFNGPRCQCGNIGCLELYSSGTGIARLGQEAMGRPITSEELFELARQGDTTSIGVLTKAGRALGTAIASLSHLYNPEIVLLNGGVAEQGDFFLNFVKDGLDVQTMPVYRVPLKLGELGAEANLFGAAELIRTYLKTQ